MVPLARCRVKLGDKTDLGAARMHEISLLQVADAGHHAQHDRLDLVSGQREGIAFGYYADGLGSAVDDHPA